MVDNKILCFTKKDTSYKDGLMYVTQINSKSKNGKHLQQLAIYMKKDESIMVKINQFHDIPLFIFMRAVGIVTDVDIVKYCIYDMNDTEMLNIIRKFNNVLVESGKNISDTNYPIKTYEQARSFMVDKIKQTTRKYSNTNNEDLQIQKLMYLDKILNDQFLPHMEKDQFKKGVFVGLMVNKLINVYLGRKKLDDRDSYINKRIDLPGVLLGQLFRQYYKND